MFDDPYVLARLRFVLPILAGDLSIHQASREMELGRDAIRGWVRRYQEHGVEGLRNRPRGKTTRRPSHAEDAILRLKRERRGRSARKIRDLLRNEGVHLHRQTVWRVLHKHGESRREPRPLKPDREFEYPEPNECWQVDIMDGIIVRGVGLVFLHSILDDHSRDVMGSQWFTNRGAQAFLTVLRDAFEANGLPKRVLADRGTQFKDSLGRGVTQYQRVLDRLGVHAMFASVGNPKAKGKKERFYGFVQSDFLQEHEFASLEDLNQKWRAWVRWYSGHHEHSSLNGEKPGERYARVRKRFSPFPLGDVFATVVERRVRTNAAVSYRRNLYPVDPKFMGQRVELRVFNGHVRIFRGAVLLGTYDARVNYRERMLRQLHARVVKRDGMVRFQGKRYVVGKRLAKRRVEVMRKGAEVRVYLPGNREKVFKLRRRYRRDRSRGSV